jgi:hypothetical protein
VTASICDAPAAGASGAASAASRSSPAGVETGEAEQVQRGKRDRLLGTTAAAAADGAPLADASEQRARRLWRVRCAGIRRATAAPRRTRGKRRKGASADAFKARHPRHQGGNLVLKPLTAWRPTVTSALRWSGCEVHKLGFACKIRSSDEPAEFTHPTREVVVANAPACGYPHRRRDPARCRDRRHSGVAGFLVELGRLRPARDDRRRALSRRRSRAASVVSLPADGLLIQPREEPDAHLTTGSSHHCRSRNSARVRSRARIRSRKCRESGGAAEHGAT